MLQCEEKYTKRQLVEAQRAAYMEGRLEVPCAARTLIGPCSCAEDAKRRYRLPKITRPREIRVEGKNLAYRISDGVVEVADVSGDWSWSSLNATPAGSLRPWELRVLLELRENPTEEVEDTG